MIVLVGSAITILLTTLFGLIAVRLLGPNLSLSVSIGLGALIGGSSLGLLALGCASLGLDARWAIVVVLGLVALGLGVGWTSLESPMFDGELLVRAVGIGVLGTNGFSLPTTVLGVLVLLLPQAGLIRIDRPAVRRIVTVAVVLVGSASSVLLTAVQPGWRYSDSNDAPFFEALSWTLTHFGLDVQPGYLFDDIRGYHVLAYLWPGVLTDATGAPPFMMLNLVIPFVAATSLALLILPSSKPHRPESRIQLVLVASFVWILGSGIVTSAIFGTWALIAYVVVMPNVGSWATNSLDPLTKIRGEVLLGTLGVIALLGKGPTIGVIGLLGIAPLLQQGLATAPRNMRQTLRNIPYHLLVVAAVAFIWYLPAKRLVTPRSPSPLKNIVNSGIREGLWASRDLLEYGPVLLLIGTGALLAVKRHKSAFDLSQPLVLLTLVGLGSTVAVWLMPDRVVRGNLTQHAFYVSLAIAVTMVNSYSWTTRSVRNFYASVAVSVPIVCVISIYSFGYVNADLASQTWFSASRWVPELVTASRTPSLMLVPAIATGLVLRRKKQTKDVGASLSIIASTIVLATAVSVLIFRFEGMQRAVESQNKLQPAPWSATIPDQETFDVGNWIRSNTPETAVLASNSFCCWNDSSYIQKILEQFRGTESESTQANPLDEPSAGSNYLLVSTAKRRFLIAGPRFVVGENKALLTYALELSLRYGTDRTEALGAELRQLGVDFFIIDKLVPSQSTIDVAPVFENRRYLVVEFSNRP